MVLLTDVFHPLVDPMTRQVDLATKFPTWTANKDFIHHVLSFIKSIFLQVPRDQYVYREAHLLLHSDPSKFGEKAQESAQISLAKMPEPQEGSSLAFPELGSEEFDKYKHLMLTYDRSRAENEELQDAYFEELFAQFPDVRIEEDEEVGENGAGEDHHDTRPPRRVTFADTDRVMEDKWPKQ